jgi:uncharacterized metal-binding protein
MPAGQVHRRLWRNNLWLAFAGTALALAYNNQGAWFFMAWTMPLGYLLGYFIDPDLDMKMNTEAKKRWKRTIILYPVVAWWILYALIARRFLGGHRSFWTHFPIVSTLLRLAWVSIPFIMLVSIIGLKMPIGSQIFWAGLFGVLLGLSLADTIHFIADLR